MTPSNSDPDHRNPASEPNNAGDKATHKTTKENANSAKQKAGEQARDKAEAGQQRASSEADALSDAIDAAASNLDDQDREGLARYARELSNNLASAAGQLEGRSVDELANDAKHLARNNPALFMLGSIAVGFGLSRFFKASGESEHMENSDTSKNRNLAREDGAWSGAALQRRESDAMKTQANSNTPQNGHGRDML